MENMASVINSTPNASIKVPCTKYQIKKMIPSKLQSELHIECSACRNYILSIGSSNVNCDKCNRTVSTSNSDYFVYLPIEQQLLLSVERNFNDIAFYCC